MGLACHKLTDAQQFDHLGDGHFAFVRSNTAQTVVQITLHAQVGKQVSGLGHIAKRAFVYRFEQPLGIVLPQVAVDR